MLIHIIICHYMLRFMYVSSRDLGSFDSALGARVGGARELVRAGVALRLKRSTFAPGSPLYFDAKAVADRRLSSFYGAIWGALAPLAQVWVLRRAPKFYEKHFEVMSFHTLLATTTATFPSSLAPAWMIEVGRLTFQARSPSHWSPYDRVGVVNADL